MSESIIGYPTILLSDGTREWVGGNAEDTDAEFQRIIRERLGDAEAESWRNYAIDVWHELQEITYAKRLDRKKLIALAERMEGDL